MKKSRPKYICMLGGNRMLEDDNVPKISNRSKSGAKRLIGEEDADVASRAQWVQQKGHRFKIDSRFSSIGISPFMVHWIFYEIKNARVYD